MANMGAREKHMNPYIATLAADLARTARIDLTEALGRTPTVSEFDECLEAFSEALRGSGDTDSPTMDDEFDDSMDGDAESALASAGFGTDEDYGYYGGEDD